MLSTLLALSLSMAPCPPADVQDPPVPVEPVLVEPEPAEAAPAEPPAEEDAPGFPTSLPEAIELPEGSLEEALEGRSLPQLEAWLDTWMAWLAQQQVAVEIARSAPEGSAEQEASANVLSDRDTLLARAELLIEAVVDAGGDADEERARLAEVRGDAAEELEDYSTVPSDHSRAQNLPLEVLRAQLRPLTREQVEEQLGLWIDLLQRKSLEVRNVEVSALRSEVADEVEKFNERAVDLRGERGRLIERVKVVVQALEKKNGDVEDVEAYLKSIVVTPPITGWRAAWTTMRAWLFNPDGGVRLGLSLARALAVLLVFWGLAILVGRIAAGAMNSMKRSSALLREFIIAFARRLVLFVGVLVAANQLGINMGPLLAIIGAAGLVVGLALQGTLSNFASGLLIMVYRPFDVGDVIDAAGITGKVEGMTLMTTLVRTFDNRTMNVPNNMVWGDVITNVTANATRRVDMVFGVDYGDDIDRAREVLLEVVRDQEKVLAEPEPVVNVHTLGESSVDFVVRPWVRTADYWDVYWAVTRAVKQRFDSEGLTIPFPQRDVHVHALGGERQLDVPRPQKDAAESEAVETPSRAGT